MGVPKALTGTSLTWDYGSLESLTALLEDNAGEVGAIILEVARSADPPPGFLEGVRALADKHSVVLIFDEVSAAWREVCGGRHLKYGVYPDIAVFSKTLSNGFAMAAMVGVCDVMEAAQETFISTSYHTERVGPTAALATIKKFMRCNVQAVNSERGARVQRGWTAAAADAGLAVSVGGVCAVACLLVPGPHCRGVSRADHAVYAGNAEARVLGQHVRGGHLCAHQRCA